MKLLRSLYLTRFFFVLLAVVVGLYCCASFLGWMRYVAHVSLLSLFGFLVLDTVLTFFVSEPVSASRRVDSLLNLGDENTVLLTVRNLQYQPLNLTVIEEFPVQLQKRNVQYHALILPGREKVFEYHFKPTQRGEYHFGNVLIYVSSALFMVRRRIELELAQTVAVYPSILQMKQFELKVFHQQTQSRGIKKLRRIGHNNEFEQIKNYVQGDDLRTVNWKATSKKSELMVNQYQDERSQHIYSLIDKSRNMQVEFESMTMLDYAINASLVFSNIAIKKGDRAGLITFSDKIGTQLAADRSSGQLRRILNLLYNQQTHFRESSFELLYESIRQTVKTRSLLMLYTNFESEFAMRRALPTLKRINQRHVLVVVFFQNNELEEVAFQRIDEVEGIYQSAVAEKLINAKVNIARVLKQNGIQTILTRPQDLSLQTINKYLELKSRGII
jgi:uncharacterized protein (DUF58 family)